MQTRPKHTVVVIPNEDKLEVSYFLSDKKVKEKEKKNYIDLIIQLHDCHSTFRIDRSILKNADAVEAMVQQRVINVKGHLC